MKFAAGGVLCLLFSAALVLYIEKDATYMQSRQSAMLSNQDLNDLNDPASQQYFGSSPSHASRVVYLIVDGLRFDALVSNPSLNAFVSEESFSVHSKIYRLRTQLPSISFPNWITLLTGATPQLHQTYGNNDLVATRFDNLFSQAMEYGIKAGVSGDSNWAAMLGRSLVPFQGDGTISLDAIDEDPHVDALREAPLEKHDQAWAEVLYEALKQGTGTDSDDKRYDFLLGYFGDPDARAHQNGAASEEYKDAVTRTAEIFSNVLQLIKEADHSSQDGDTILVITADHGHVDVGGHGGLAQHILDVPFIIYQNNSFLGSSTTTPTTPPTTPQHFGRELTSLDGPTTISALLGLPIPRESQGVFIEDAFTTILNHSVNTNGTDTLLKHYRDLFRQKQQLISHLLATIGSTSELSSGKISGLLDEDQTCNSIEECQQQIAAVMALSDSGENNALTRRVTRNFSISAAISVVLFIVLSLVMKKTTYCHFQDIWVSQSDYLIQTRKVLSAQVQRQAFIAAAIGVILYFLWSFAMFFLVYRVYRHHSQWKWDFTLFNSALDAYIYLMVVMLPGCFFILSSHMGVYIWFRKRVKVSVDDDIQIEPSILTSPTASRSHPLLPDVELDSSYSSLSSPTFENQPRQFLTARIEDETRNQWHTFLHLFLSYTVLIVLITVICFFAFQSYRCVFFSDILPVQFIWGWAWQTRFRSLAVAFMVLPLTSYLTVAHLVHSKFFFAKPKTK